MGEAILNRGSDEVGGGLGRLLKKGLMGESSWKSPFGHDDPVEHHPFPPVVLPARNKTAELLTPQFDRVKDNASKVAIDMAKDKLLDLIVENQPYVDPNLLKGLIGAYHHLKTPVEHVNDDEVAELVPSKPVHRKSKVLNKFVKDVVSPIQDQAPAMFYRGPLNKVFSDRRCYGHLCKAPPRKWKWVPWVPRKKFIPKKKLVYRRRYNKKY